MEQVLLVNILRKITKRKIGKLHLSHHHYQKNQKKLMVLNISKLIFGKKTIIKKAFNKNFDYAVNLAGYVDHSNFKETYSSHYLGCKNLVDILSNKN